MNDSAESSGPPGKRPPPVGNSGRKLPAMSQSPHRRLPSPEQHVIPEEATTETIESDFSNKNFHDSTFDRDEADEIIPTKDITPAAQSSPGKTSVAYISETMIRKLGKKDNISEVTTLNLTLVRDHMNKKIKYIENLDKLKKLQVLNLSNNIIEKIERLDKLTQLRELNLANNLITKIEGLDNLSRLQVLNLSRNQIEHIPAGMFKKLRELRVVALSHNHLEALVEVSRLKPLPDLVKFSVEGNPLANLAHSRQFIIFQLRSLEFLDGKVVTEEDREAADIRFGQEEVRRLQDELDKQQKKCSELENENEKILLEVQRLTNLHNQQKSKSEKQVDKIKELRRELDSNTDLLKRKNAELSKACEKQFKLEQELAFYKLDAKFEHLGKIPFPDGAEFQDAEKNDESPYIGKAGFKPNEFAWDAFVQSPEQKAQFSPGQFHHSGPSGGRTRMPQQELGEAIIFELQAKEQAIRDSEEHLAALKEELFLTEQQLRDASDQLERVQKAIQHQGKHLGDKEKKILDTIDLKMKFIRDLEKLAADLENKMNEVGDDIRQKEDELEALRQNLESTPPDDKAYSELLDGFVTKEQQLKNVMNDFDKLKNEYDKVIGMLRQEMADVKKLEDDRAALRDKAKKDEEKLKEDLQDLVKELTRQLDEMKGEANQQKKRIGELQQEKEQLGRKVKELQQQMGQASELKERAAKLQKQLQDTQAALDHEKQRSGATRLPPAPADDNDAKLKETKERLLSAQSDVDKLRKALDKLKKQQQADRQAADDRIKKEQEKVEKALQAAREMRDKERQRRDLELQVDALKAENASFADRLREAEKELDKWHMGDSLDKEEVLRILGDLVDDIDRGDVRVMSPLVEHDDLDKALASLQKRYNDILGALQRERQGSQKDRRATDSEIQALEGRLADTENALQKTRDKANQLERANKVKDDDLKQMADDLRKLKDKLSGQKALGEELDKERSAHAMAVRELEAQLEQMKDKFRKTRAGLEKELANARAPLLEKISNLEDAIRPLQQKLSKAVGEVDRLTAEKNAAVSDQGELEHQIAGLLKALQEAEDRARDAEARLGREKRRLEGKVRDLEDELRRVKGQLKNLKEDADIQLQRQQAKRDAEMQSLRDELKRMKEKLKDVQENAAIEAARNKHREERKVRELEDELLGLMDDLKKRVDQLGRAQDEAATLRNLLNDKESQLKTAAQREREQQARLRGIEEQLNKLRRLQHDIGAQTLQSELDKELKSVKDEQRRAAARGAAARELDAAQEQIAALQTLLRDKDKQLQDAMHRGSNNSEQLAARRDELSNLAAALREQSAEIGRLKTMFGQQFPFRADGLRQSSMNVSALASELESLRNTVRDREQQIKDMLEHSGSQFPPGTLFPASLKENQTTFIPVGGGTAATTAGDSTMITTAAAAPGSGVFPAERNGAVPMASEIHHHHHHHLRKTSPRGIKKSVSIRNQDSTLSPVALAASAITSSTPGQVHHHHYSVGPHGKERTRMRKQGDALFCNVPYHEELENEVEELGRMLDANPASSHRIKNARDRESLRMELQDLEGEVEDAMKRRSSLKRTQHQALDATLAKFQDHLLTLVDHKVRLSTSH